MRSNIVSTPDNRQRAHGPKRTEKEEFVVPRWGQLVFIQPEKCRSSASPHSHHSSAVWREHAGSIHFDQRSCVIISTRNLFWTKPAYDYDVTLAGMWANYRQPHVVFRRCRSIILIFPPAEWVGIRKPRSFLTFLICDRTASCSKSWRPCRWPCFPS